MEHSGWRRPSPALLVACLALFVALGGTVLAATKIDGRTIQVKSLPGNRLVVGSIPGNRLQPGTIPGSRLAKRSVKGDQIDIGTLGQVPSAAHADSADAARRAATATAADYATDASTINGRSVGCSGTQRQFAGGCWDLQLSTKALSSTEAATACASEGGELPDGVALLAFAQQPGAQLALGGEWTNQVVVTNPDAYGLVVLSSSGFSIHTSAEPLQFRCVTSLVG